MCPFSVSDQTSFLAVQKFVFYLKWRPSRPVLPIGSILYSFDFCTLLWPWPLDPDRPLFRPVYDFQSDTRVLSSLQQITLPLLVTDFYPDANHEQACDTHFWYLFQLHRHQAQVLNIYCKQPRNWNRCIFSKTTKSTTGPSKGTYFMNLYKCLLTP